MRKAPRYGLRRFLLLTAVVLLVGATVFAAIRYGEREEKPSIEPVSVGVDSDLDEVLDPMPLGRIVPSYNTLFAKVDTEYSFSARVFDDELNEHTADLVCRSSDESVAVVADGVIIAVGEGSCTIYVGDKRYAAVAKISVVVGEAKWYGGFTYIDGILVVNKNFALPESFGSGLNAEFNSAFTKMKEAAAKDGYTIRVVSGFRTYSYQEVLFSQAVARNGLAHALRSNARAGHSEHQSGYAADLNWISSQFANTAEGKWLADNSWRFGFILRYTNGDTAITGYKYEPWHFRYVGDAAAEIYEKGLTLEEYLGIDWIPIPEGM